MDRRDIKATGKTTNVLLVCSSKDQNIFAQAKDISYHSGISSDVDTEVQENRKESNHETTVPESANFPETKRSGHIDSSGCRKEKIDGSRSLSTPKLELDQKIRTEETSKAMHCSDGCAGQGIPKEVGVSLHSPERVDVSKDTTVNSNISSDRGEAFKKGRSELVAVEVNGCQQSACESESKTAVTTFNDKQYKTESFSSNSMHLILPSSSNDSCQETSVDGKSWKHSSTGTNGSSACTDLDSNFEDSAGGSLERCTAVNPPNDLPNVTIFSSGMLYNVVKSPENVVKDRGPGDDKARIVLEHNSMSLESSIPKSNLSKTNDAEFPDYDKAESCFEMDNDLEVARRATRDVEREFGVFREPSGCSFSIKERNRLHVNCTISASSEKIGSLTEDGRNMEMCREQDKCGGTSDRDVASLDISTRKQQLSSKVRETSQCADCRMMHGFSSPSANKSSNSSEIDLNIDISTNEVECPQQLVKEGISYYGKNVFKPIAVMPKSGIPTSFSILQLQYKSELHGWRGSASTSAFRPTYHFNSCERNNASNEKDELSKHSLLRGFDLNVVAAEDDSTMESVPAQITSLPEESSVLVTPLRERSFDIDLNCGGEKNDNHYDVSPVRDFDLNASPMLTDACVDAQQQFHCVQGLRSGNSCDPACFFLGSAKGSGSNGIGPSYWTEFSSIQDYNPKPFIPTAPNMLPLDEKIQRASSFQPKLTYATYPHAFIQNNNGFYIDPNNSLTSRIYSANALPYLAGPHGTSVIPQLSGSGTHSPFLPASYQFLSAPGSSDPISFDRNNWVNAAEYGGRDVRPSPVPVNSSEIKEYMKPLQQVSMSMTPMKRREPDGGWNSHQFPCR